MQFFIAASTERVVPIESVQLKEKEIIKSIRLPFSDKEVLIYL